MTRKTYEHGTAARYRHNACRCDSCRAANTAEHSRLTRRYAREKWTGQSELWVPAVGTRRRLQALTAAGWSGPILAAKLGYVSREGVCGIRTGTRPHCHRDIAERVRRVYDELSAQPLPTDGYSQRTRRYAALQGWSPPMAWDDDALDDPDGRPYRCSPFADREDKAHVIDWVAVERAVAGHRPDLMTRSELQAAVDILTEQGVSTELTADILRVTERTITRRRTA